MPRIFVLPLLGVAVLAGCGGGGKPAIDPAVAQRLARQADAVAASSAARNPCAAAHSAAALQAATIRAINAHEIPERYQETLQTRANELVAELRPECLPSVTAAPTAPTPAQAPVVGEPGRGRDHGHGKQHGHGKGHDD